MLFYIKPGWLNFDIKIIWRRGLLKEIRRQHGRILIWWWEEPRLQVEFKSRPCFLCWAAECFYTRFNIINSGVNWDQTDLSNSSTPISVEEQRVVSILSKLQPRKAPGMCFRATYWKSVRPKQAGWWLSFSSCLWTLGMFWEHGRRQPLFLSQKNLC